MFSKLMLPTPTDEYDFDSTLEAKMEGSSNAAVSFARECLRLDPKQRPTAKDLLEHDFFSDFRDWFEDEIEVLLEYDN